MTRSGKRVFWALATVVGGLALAGSVAFAWPLWGGAGPVAGTWGPMHGWGAVMGGGMMGPGMMGGSMMGPGGQWGPAGDVPLAAGEVAAQVRQALQAWGLRDLQVGHIMEFDNGFYVVVKRPDGKGAFELLVDRHRGTIHPEPGPNMMWNTEFGHMQVGGPVGRPAFGPERARGAAQEYLNRQLPGSQPGELTEFPGYYTLDVVLEGRTVGMLSVNAYTGQVWYHHWHGTFIGETEADDDQHAAGESAR